MPPTVTAASFFDAHETRIQSLESQGTESTAILSRMQGDMHHLQESQEDTYGDLQRIKEMLTDISDKSRQGFQAVDHGLRAVAPRVEALEKVRQASDDAVASFKRRLVAGVVFVGGAVGGAILSKFGEALWTAFRQG